MKRLLVFLLTTALLLSLAGCKGSTPPQLLDPDFEPLPMNPGKVQTDYPGIEIRIDSLNWQQEDGKTTLTVAWNNNTDLDAIYGAAYTIERLDGEEWVSCAMQDDLAFIEIAYELNAGQTTKENYNLTDSYDVSSPGTYRFKTDCYVHENATTSTKCELIAEFTIGSIKCREESKVTGTEIAWCAQYIRTNGGYEARVVYPCVRIIHSLHELNDYYDTWHEVFDLERKDQVYADTTIGFLDVCDQYDEGFFEENYLIFVLLEEGSGSVRHEVRSVELTEDQKISISIDRKVPEVGTADMAQWHIILELSRDVLVENSIDTYLYVDGLPSYMDDQNKDTYTEPTTTDTRYIEYTDQWLNKETALHSKDITANTLFISQIYSNCFFGYISTAPNEKSYEIKVNGQLSEEWCFGDAALCTYNNLYCDEVNGRQEADLLTIEPGEFLCYKPVIYIYPEKEAEVSVQLQLDGKLTCTYPAYNSGWKVTAAPDGTLTDAKGQTYNYLYWEGETNAQWNMTEGFCVKGEDTAAFLEDALSKLGLNRKEANEFIVYWLPLMEQNPYNIISFQTDIYTDAAQLQITPTPDTLIRVFMAWRAADAFTELEEQELIAPERTGFTVVEWGGTQLP